MAFFYYMDSKANVAESRATDLKLGMMISQVLIVPDFYRYVGDIQGFSVTKKPVLYSTVKGLDNVRLNLLNRSDVLPELILKLRKYICQPED